MKFIWCMSSKEIMINRIRNGVAKPTLHHLQISGHLFSKITQNSLWRSDTSKIFLRSKFQDTLQASNERVQSCKKSWWWEYPRNSSLLKQICSLISFYGHNVRKEQDKLEDYLSKVSIIVVNHHDQKQLENEMVFFCLQCHISDNQWEKPRWDFKHGRDLEDQTDGEDM